jgi:dolichol-phosphate mannosyltransferase
MVVDLTIFNLLLLAGADVILSHVTSFVAATLFNYALNARWAFAATARLGDEAGWKRYLRFLVVCVLALILRGAVLEALAWKHGWPFSVAILPAIGAATLVNFVGSAFFIFGGAACRTSPEIRWRVLGLAVFAYSLALRLVFAGIVDLMPEEAYYWTYAQHPDIGYLDHPPMVAWLIWLGTWALGDTEIGVRLPAIACWLGASWFVYALTASQFGKTAGCRALALMSVFPIYFFTGVLMLPDAPLLAAWAGCLFFAQRALFAQRRWAWIGFGACLGVGLLSKYTIALLGPAALAFVLLDRPSRRWLLRPEPLLGALLAAALFSPVIVWNAMHGWESFTFQGSRRWSGDPAFSLHLLGGSIFLLLTPLGAIAAAEAVMHRWLGSRAPEDSDPLLIRRRLFATVFTIAPLSVFVVHALQDNPKINWTGPVWLAVIPLIAHAMTARPGAAVSRVARFGQSLWKPTVVGMTLLLGSTLYSMVIGPPVMPPFRTMQLPIAWEEMMREVEQIELGVIAETGREPVIVGLHDYFITAEHAFYDPAGDGLAETAGRGLFGYQGLMWDSWRPPRDVVGKDVLVLAFSAAQLTSPKVERQFLSMGPPQRVPVHKRGREAGQFFFRVGYGYQLDPSRAGVGGAME